MKLGSLYLAVMVGCSLFAGEIKTHALLIGISKYEGTGFFNLRGPRADLEYMESFISKNFPNPNITILKEEQATHENIIRHLEKLSKVGRDDQVILYFTGHGSLTKDLNHDETWGYDATWVTFGARTRGEGSEDLNDYDLLDDEINHYLSLIPSKNILVISDSCHSGTITRPSEAPAIMVRGMERDPREHIKGKAYPKPEKIKWISLSAAKENHKAYEHYLNDVYSGRFTWALVKTMERSSPQDTWGQVMERVALEFHKNFWHGQQPQIEGDKQMQVNFKKARSLSQEVIVGEKEGDQWVLPAGSAVGVQKGSIFSKGETKLMVERVSAFQAFASLSAGPAPEKGSFVRLTGVMPDMSERVRLSVAADFEADEHLVQAIKKQIAEVFPHQIELVPEREVYQWQIRVLHRPENFKDVFSVPKGEVRNPREAWVVTERGLPLVNGPVLKLEEKLSLSDLERVLLSLLKRRTLLELEDGRDSPDFQFAPKFFHKGLPSIPGGENFRDADGNQYGEIQHFENGSILPLETVLAYDITNKAATRRYIYVINFGPDGSVYTAFPDGIFHEDEALVQAGDTRRIRLDGAIYFFEEGYENVRIISSKKPLPLQFLQVRASAVRDGDSKNDPLEISDWSTQLNYYKVTNNK